MAVQAQPRAQRARVSWFQRQRDLAPYLFLAPFFVLFASFFVYPVAYSLFLSFHQQKGLSQPTWIGLQNYAALLTDTRFLQAIWNTTYFALGSIFIQLPLAFLLALAFNSVYARHFTNLYRIGYFFPVLTSAVVVALIFALVLNSEYGMLNALLNAVGLPNIPWLSSTTWAMPSVILLGVWTWTGFNAFYFLAGLKNISAELIEAARIDGANRWQVLTQITIPLIRPVMLFVIIQSIIGSYSLFAQPFLLTKGGPSDATLTISMYLYFNGFQYFNLGYAAAIGYSLVLIILALSLINLYAFGAFRED
jgi:ABC-type sugar transport system permease subunit